MPGAASPEEAAAVIAALERFIAETAPIPGSGARPSNPWQRTALLEGVSAKEAFASPWGEPRTWGARESRSRG
jgi:hypothetical protein